MDLWPLVFIPLTLLIAISISWTQSRGAPWVPSSIGEVDKMLALAEVGPNDVVYDLGCGDGRTLVTAARLYGARAVGIEIDPLRYLWCQMLITVLLLRGRVKIVYGDFFNLDLSGADVVTCYLLQSTNEKLQGKLMEELHANARVVSNDFTFPRLRLYRQDTVSEIYLYHPVPMN
jgi:SAM-dependent methyltransferase